MKVVYTAGRYHADSEWMVEHNIREAERFAQIIWKEGGVALCPHKNTSRWGGLFANDKFIEGCIELLSRCDAIFLLPGWDKSDGAMKEKKFAEQVHIPIFDNMEKLVQWLKREEPSSESYEVVEDDHISVSSIIGGE